MMTTRAAADTATVGLQYAAFIAAIATAITAVAVCLKHQQECAQHMTFESHLIDVVIAVVTSACCGCLLHARLGPLAALFASHHEIAANSAATVAITPKPTIVSSLHAECAAEFQGPEQSLKQNRRGCASSGIRTGGEGDEKTAGCTLTSETVVGASAMKNRIALLRARRCNALSSDDAHKALSEMPNGLAFSLSSSSPAAGCPESNANGKLNPGIFPNDSAREVTLLDARSEMAVDNGSMPPSPAATTMAGTTPERLEDARPRLLQPSRSLPGRTPQLIPDARNRIHSPLSKALLKILPGLPSTTLSRASRSQLKSGCATFTSTLDKSDFWQILNKQLQGADSCNRPSGIIEIMSVGCTDPTTQRILAKILVAGHGFGFCSMDSGEDAVEELKDRYKAGGKESLPILILMDTKLRGSMDGYDATKKIRSLFPDVALPIIMLSPSSNLEISTFQSALEAGANDVVTQPITKHNLMARIGCQLKTLHFWRGQLESRQNEVLLTEMLPNNIINKLKQGHTGCIYEELEEVSVLFTDIVSFTSLSASHPTEEIIHMLDSLFTEFDKLTDKHGLYKVETIGEKTFAYRPACVKNLTLKNPSHYDNT